jgi:hypothetical protein
VKPDSEFLESVKKMTISLSYKTKKAFEVRCSVAKGCGPFSRVQSFFYSFLHEWKELIKI